MVSPGLSVASLSAWRRALALALGIGCTFLPKDGAAADTNSAAVQYAEFGTKFAKLLPAGGMSGNDAFDVDTMTDRTVKLVPDRAGERAKIRVAVQAAVEKMVAGLQGSKVQYLRLREGNGETRALIRINGRDNSLNYLELILGAPSARPVKAVDVYNLSSGESLTESLQRLLTVLDPQLSLMDRFTGKQREALNRLNAASELFNHSQAGDHQGVLRSFAALPPELQRQKVFIILRTKSAVKVSSEEYLAAMNFWKATYPNDAAIDLVSIDACLLQNQFEQALAAVDRLDTALGGDPYLDYMRAGIYRKMGRNEQADAFRQKAMAADGTAPRLAASASPTATPAYGTPARVPGPTRTAVATGNNKAMRLQGVFLRTGAPSAIINGKNVAEGDVFDGNKIVKIEAQRVTLQNENGELFKLTYQ